MVTDGEEGVRLAALALRGSRAAKDGSRRQSVLRPRSAVLWRALSGMLVASGMAWPAAGDTVIAGKSAQALRCAAYIGMAAQYGYDEGVLSAEDRDLMTYWSVLVLERWVPLDPARRLEAYRTTLAELGSRYRTYTLLVRHADWCLQEFTPKQL